MSQLDKKSQAWSALFSEPMSELVQRYTASVGFDKRLWRADIRGSLAHAEMLCAQGLISAEDWRAIERGLDTIIQEIESGRFQWRLDLEDVLVRERIGDGLDDHELPARSARNASSRLLP